MPFKPTIKNKLIILAISIFFILGIASLWMNNFIQKTTSLNSLRQSAQLLVSNLDRLNQYEKDFQLEEKYDPHFFEKKESKNVQAFVNTIHQTQSFLETLAKDPHIQKFNLLAQIRDLTDLFDAYEQTFLAFEQATLQKGFKDWGLIGLMRRSVHDVYDVTKAYSQLSDLNARVLTLRKHEKDYLLRKDLKYRKKFKKEIEQTCALVKTHPFIAANQKTILIQRLKQYQQRFLNVIKKDIELGLTQKDGIQKQLAQNTAAITPALQSIISIIEEKSFQEKNQAKRTLLVFIGCTLLVLFLVIYMISTSISKSIHYAHEIIGAIAEGNLDVNIQKKYNDELGTLMISMQNMLSRWKHIIYEIQKSVGELVSASKELSSNSNVISEGASEQAALSEEVSSSVDQISNTIKENTGRAQDSEKLTLGAAENIQNKSDNVTQTLNVLHEIAEKIQVINDISFQTNILALNAAVEAARAGQHGKGFAVVAAEVRKLAERTNHAATEINELSKSSLELSGQSGTNLEEIVQQIRQTAIVTKDIAANSFDQNSSIDQINDAINNLNDITQQNASTSEEMASNSQGLAQQAAHLKEIIQFFNAFAGNQNAAHSNNIQPLPNGNRKSDSIAITSSPEMARSDKT